MLRRGLRQFSFEGSTTSGTGDETDADSTYSSSPVVEPLSWTRLAYTSFIWWASAGENRDGLSEEEEEQQIEQDARLLASVESLAYPAPNATGRAYYSQDHGQEPPEVALVAYFRRLTTQIFFTLAGAIARHDNDDQIDEQRGADYADTAYLGEPADGDTDLSLSMSRQTVHGDDANSPLLRQRSHMSPTNRIDGRRPRDDPDSEEPITITIADMAEMGLDVWSATDRVFVEELVSLWWGRPAHVDSARIRCCGISIL